MIRQLLSSISRQQEQASCSKSDRSRMVRRWRDCWIRPCARSALATTDAPARRTPCPQLANRGDDGRRGSEVVGVETEGRHSRRVELAGRLQAAPLLEALD